MKPKRNLWPLAIIAFFSIAILGIALFISFAARQDMDLVREDYYAEELRFQTQMERVTRTGKLSSRATITYEPREQRVQITLPLAQPALPAEGYVHLYRPSDASLDLNVKLATDARGVQRVDASGLLPGLWKVRVLWKADGEEFYSEQAIIVTAKHS